MGNNNITEWSCYGRYILPNNIDDNTRKSCSGSTDSTTIYAVLLDLNK